MSPEPRVTPTAYLAKFVAESDTALKPRVEERSEILVAESDTALKPRVERAKRTKPWDRFDVVSVAESDLAFSE